MDFRVLTYFVAVAEELNFTRAAEKLHMSQPPLSNQIQNLENDLGVQLFIRSKHGLQITEAGMLLLERSKQILSLSEKTRSDIGYLKTELNGNITIGIVDGKAPFIAADWIGKFKNEYPHVQYELWNGSGDDVINRLERGLCDLAVIAAPFDNERLESIKIEVEPWIAILPKDHALAKLSGNEIELKMLVGQKLIVPRRSSRITAIQGWFESIGEKATIIATMSHYVDAIALVENNVGIGIFPNTPFRDSDLVVKKLITEPAKVLEYNIVWRKNRINSSLTEAFINFVKAIINDKNTLKTDEIQFNIPKDAELL